MWSGVKLAPDQITVAVTNFCADVLRSLALPIRIDRQTASVIADLVEDGVRRCVSDAGLEIAEISGVCVGLPGVVERAAGVCRQSPILQRARRAVRRRSHPAPRRARFDRQRRQSGDAGRTLVRAGARPERFPGRQRRAQPGPRHSSQRRIVSRRERAQSGPRRSHGSPARRRRRAARRPGVRSVGARSKREASMRGSEHDGALHTGRAMALLLQRAADGDKRCVARARRRGRGAGLRRRQSHHPVRAAEGHHLRPRHGDQRAFHRAAAQDRRSPSAAEPRRRLRHHRARMERRKSGCRAPPR